MKYQIDIDISFYGLTLDGPYYAQYDTIVSEGDNLVGLLEDATAYASDQDGGEAGESSIYDTGYYNLMEQIIEREYNKLLKEENEHDILVKTK